MYRAIDDRVLACSTTHVGVEDAETAGVSIGTGWFVIKAFFHWLKEKKVPAQDFKNRHKLRKTKILRHGSGRLPAQGRKAAVRVPKKTQL